MKTDKLKEHIKQLVREMLEEESTSGDAGAYLTPNAFSKKTNNKIATMYGMKLVKPKKNKSMNENDDKIQKVADFLKQYNFEEKWGTGPKAVDTPVARKQQQYIEDKFGISHAEFSEAWKLAFSKVDESNYDKPSLYGAPSKYGAASDYDGSGLDSITEKLQQIIKEELLNEVTYNKFKNEVKFRTKNEMLHRGIREVKRKLNEVERLIEYTSRMKQELSEDSEGAAYWTRSLKAINEINEISERISTKIKDIHQ